MEIEVGLLRLQSFRNLRDIGLQFCFVIQINLCNLTAIQENCSRIADTAVGLLGIANIQQLSYTVGHPTVCRGGCVSSATRQWD